MSESCRMAILIGTYYPVVGGGERHAQLLAETMVRQGHEVLVITRHSSPDLPKDERLNGVRILRTGPANQPRWGKYLMLPGAKWLLWKHRKDYDVLMICAFRVLGWLGNFAKTVLRKPVIMRAEACGEWNGAFLSNQQDRSHGRVLASYIAFRNRLFLRMNRFLSISRVIRSEFEEGGIPASKIVDLTNGIDLAPFVPVQGDERMALRERLTLPVESKIFAFAGKLIRGKGVEFLVKVFSRIASDHPEAHLLLIGSGADQFLSCEDEVRAVIAAQGLADRVTLTGYVDNVSEYMQASDALVFASEAESLGLVAVEAMACGLPVLVSAVGGLLDVVEDGVSGRLLPVGDEHAWESAWREILDHPEAGAAWGVQARKRVEAHFDIEHIARETSELVRTLNNEH